MGVAMADARQRMVVSSLPKPFRLSELRAVLSNTPMLVEQ
jgi:hypothetical protein